MAIHQNLTRVPKQQLREVGWSKTVGLVKVARKDGEDFDCATWLHKAKELPKEGFKGEAEHHLTGKEGSRGELSTSSFTRVRYQLLSKPLKPPP